MKEKLTARTRYHTMGCGDPDRMGRYITSDGERLHAQDVGKLVTKTGGLGRVFLGGAASASAIRFRRPRLFPIVPHGSIRNGSRGNDFHRISKDRSFRSTAADSAQWTE